MISTQDKNKQQQDAAANEGAGGKELALQDSVAAKKMVTKRDGRAEEFSAEKLRTRMDQLTDGLATKYMGLDACLQKVSAYAHSGTCLTISSISFFIYL